MIRIYLKWFGKRQEWTDTAYREMISIIGISDHIQITENDATADYILVYNKHLTQQSRFELKLLVSEYFRRNANRIIIYDETDEPTFIISGLYVSTDTRTTGHHILPVPYLQSKLMLINPPDYRIKDTLCSFWGRDSHEVRRQLFTLNKDHFSIENTSHFDFFDMSPANQQNILNQRSKYLKSLSTSKYSLCPRGLGTCSIRLFESIRSHAVPIIISDHYEAPRMFDWELASIRIRQSQVQQISEILANDESTYEKRVHYIKRIASVMLTPNGISEYIATSMPRCSYTETFKRLTFHLTKKSLKRLHR